MSKIKKVHISGKINEVYRERMQAEADRSERSLSYVLNKALSKVYGKQTKIKVNWVK